MSCGSVEQPNLLTIAWTGIVNTHPPMTYISIRPERFSYPLIKQSGEFVINLTTAPMVRAVDFCGVRSGRDTDKLAACGLHVEPSSVISCPRLVESPLTLECRVVKELELGSHNMLLSEIIAVSADERLLDKSGRLCLERAQLLAFAHGGYYRLGEQLGSFGFSVRKKPPQSQKRKPKGR